MELAISSQIDILRIKENLSKNFPNYKVKQPMLNKRAVNVISGTSSVLIFKKGNQLKVNGNLNIMKTWVFIVFVLLLFFTFLGAFVFYGILWYAKKEEIKTLEQEVATFIKDNHL